MTKSPVFYLSFALLTVIFLIIPRVKLSAQNDVDRRLNVAVTGFDLDEAGAKKAIANGAHINQQNDAMGGETLLIASVKGFKDAKVIKFLVDNGADLSIKDNSGKTALDWAEQYRIGKNNNGREILKLLGHRPANTATGKTGAPAQVIRNSASAVTAAATNKITAGGPTVNQVKQSVEKSLTSAYQNHFYGVKNNVSFEWSGGIIVGQSQNRAGLMDRCYPVKLQVKITITDPRDGNTTTIVRGMDAMIGGFHKTEIFCFYKNGFGEWEYTPYEP